MWRLDALQMAASVLTPEYRLGSLNMDWFHDEEFDSYLRKFDIATTYNPPRRWMLWQLTKLAHDVEGDTAECGVQTGSSSWLICKGLGRKHHGFDSFEGLSEPVAKDGTFWKKGNLTISEQVATDNLSEFDVTLYKGWIPDRFPEVADRKFAFVHIDVDIYQPTLDSIEFFYPRLNPGGVLVCDDYGFTNCPGATAAIDEYMADKPEEPVALSSGSCFIVKR
jgi:O-methyltransferase